MAATSFAVIQTAFSSLEFPGWRVPLAGLHVNMFTIPGLLLTAFFCCTACRHPILVCRYIASGSVAVLALLATRFDGTMREAPVALSPRLIGKRRLSTAFY